MIHARPKTIPT